MDDFWVIIYGVLICFTTIFYPIYIFALDDRTRRKVNNYFFAPFKRFYKLQKVSKIMDYIAVVFMLLVIVSFILFLGEMSNHLSNTKNAKTICKHNLELNNNSCEEKVNYKYKLLSYKEDKYRFPIVVDYFSPERDGFEMVCSCDGRKSHFLIEPGRRVENQDHSTDFISVEEHGGNQNEI